MKTNKGESLLRLTASCEVAVRSIGREGGYVVLEVTQRKAAGEKVTTLLLGPDRARELASLLLQHSGGDGARTACADGEEVGAVLASLAGAQP